MVNEREQSVERRGQHDEKLRQRNFAQAPARRRLDGQQRAILPVIEDGSPAVQSSSNLIEQLLAVAEDEQAMIAVPVLQLRQLHDARAALITTNARISIKEIADGEDTFALQGLSHLVEETRLMVSVRCAINQH